MVTPTDPLYGSQWHFSLIGDIETIWDDYTGDGVHVVVYDDGVEYTHPDLNDNYDPTSHFQYGGLTYDAMPISNSDAHGTACAGLIGAEANNGIGGAGVAWGVTLTGVNFLSDIQYESASAILASLNYAQNFDVMSNSWGNTPSYADWQNMSNSDPSTGWRWYMLQEYEDVVELGRGGLGTVIVQAAGNDALNSQGDGLNTSRFTISVAATSSSGEPASYSNYGTCILIAAPAASVTTDLTDSAGYNTNTGTAGDYTTTFGGTSAATPVTAGVVALMLEANSDLGWRDVQNILAISASQTGSTYGTSSTVTYEQGDWFSNGATNWNGGGMSYHLSYGYGMLDAYAAVRMAEVWSELYPNVATSANEQSFTANYTGGPVAIPDDNPAGASAGIVVAQDILIEDIYVTVDLTHSYSSDLTLYLVGPNGEEFMLMDNEGSETLMDGGFTWTFGVTAALGMTSAGTWSIKAVDSVGSDVGTIDDFSLEFFGSAISNDDIYHFTSDFLELAAVDHSRTTLSDTNGGVDWLNFAVIAGNLTIYLNAGGTISVDGILWATIASGSVFEHFAAGDGNDYITGNSQGNRVLAGRGADVVFGGGGSDSLSGGRGSDTLWGQSGSDLLEGGDGSDLLFADVGDDTLIGGAGEDRLFGHAGADVMDGGEDRDIYIIDNLDVVNDTGTTGFDVAQIESAAGDSISLSGWSGLERVNGYLGDDVLDATGYGAAIFFYGWDGSDTLTGTDFGDTISGGAGNDSLNGMGGSDTLYGRSGNDEIFGGAGNDGVFGDIGDDTLRGGAGTDTLIGHGGADSMDGGDDGDIYGIDNLDTVTDTGTSGYDAAQIHSTVGIYLGLSGWSGLERIDGNIGNDTIDGSGYGTALFMFGANGNDHLIGTTYNDTLAGGNGNDRLFAGDGADTLLGGGGADTLFGQGGADYLDGGEDGDIYSIDGDDTIVDTGSSGYDAAQIGSTLGVAINMTGWSGLEQINGNTGNDTIDASGYGTSLVMLGGDGSDSLIGSSGNDTMFGGNDADVFVFNAGFGADQISDFEDGTDMIDFSGHAGVTSISDLVITQHANGTDTVVTLAAGGGDQIILTQTIATDMTADDFVFV